MRHQAQLTKLLLSLIVFTVFSTPCFSEDRGTTYYCVESQVLGMDMSGEVTNFRTGKFVLNVKNHVVTLNPEGLNEDDQILYPYWTNPQSAGQFWVRNHHCDLKLMSMETNSQQLVCSYGHMTGVMIRMFRCKTF